MSLDVELIETATLLFVILSPQVLEHRLKEADEVHTLLQLECEKYKAVLAETVGNDWVYISVFFFFFLKSLTYFFLA